MTVIIIYGVTIDTEIFGVNMSHKIIVTTNGRVIHHYNITTTEMSHVQILDHIILKAWNCHVKRNVGQTFSSFLEFQNKLTKIKEDRNQPL